MTDHSPQVSVVLAVYNGMPWLPAAAGSILSQTFTDLELLLVDDGSTDGSSAACDALAADDPRVRVIHQPNAGNAASLNLGIAETSGPYVAIMDADDLSYPDRIERQVAFLDEHSAVGAVGCQADCFDGERWSVWGETSTPIEIRWVLLFTTPFAHPSVLFRRSALERIGGYDEQIPSLHDYDLLYRMSKGHDLFNLTETMFFVNRMGQANDSIVNRNLQFDTALQVHRAVFSDYGVPLPERHARTVSGCLFSSLAEVDQVIGPISLAALDSVGRSMHRLARAFTRREAPSAEMRSAIEATLRWRSGLLVEHAMARDLLSPQSARALRLSWDLPAAVRRVARRLAPR